MMLVNKTVLRKDMLTMRIKLLQVQPLSIYLISLSESLLKAEWSECGFGVSG